MVRLTARDDAMLEWFQLVRLANMEGVRWVLGALNGWDEPVSLRQAQGWCARMESVGLVGRARVSVGGGSVVWATHSALQMSPPDLFRQTSRHEVAVALASARFAAAGWSWVRDRRPADRSEHRGDGVAWRGDQAALVEVELTPKAPHRYRAILAAVRRRQAAGEVSQVIYLCTPDAARAVTAAAQLQPPGLELTVASVFDRAGVWADESQPAWMAEPIAEPAR